MQPEQTSYCWANSTARTIAPTKCDALYVTNANSNTVSVINTAANTVVATVPVGFWFWHCDRIVP